MIEKFTNQQKSLGATDKEILEMLSEIFGLAKYIEIEPFALLENFMQFTDKVIETCENPETIDFTKEFEELFKNGSNSISN